MRYQHRVTITHLFEEKVRKVAATYYGMITCNFANASSAEPEAWATFLEALDACERHQYDGIGFMFGNSPYTGIDLDHCHDPATGKIDG